jgi:hypothetical protein
MTIKFMPLKPWLDTVHSILQYYMFVSRYGDREIIKRVAASLSNATGDLLWAVRKYRQPRVRMNPYGPHQPLEKLEREFYRMREDTEAFLHRIARMKAKRRKVSSKELKISRDLTQATGISARNLKALLESKGQWTEWYGREHGISRWL